MHEAFQDILNLSGNWSWNMQLLLQKFLSGFSRGDCGLGGRKKDPDLGELPISYMTKCKLQPLLASVT